MLFCRVSNNSIRVYILLINHSSANYTNFYVDFNFSYLPELIFLVEILFVEKSIDNMRSQLLFNFFNELQTIYLTIIYLN